MNKKIYFLVLLNLLLIFTQSCENEDIITERDYPRVDIVESIVQNESGISFEGKFLTRNEEILDKGFVWNITTNPFLHNSQSISAGEGYEEGTFKATACEGFLSGTEYRVRAFAVIADKTIYSRTILFQCTHSCN